MADAVQAPSLPRPIRIWCVESTFLDSNSEFQISIDSFRLQQSVSAWPIYTWFWPNERERTAICCLNLSFTIFNYVWVYFQILQLQMNDYRYHYMFTTFVSVEHGSQYFLWRRLTHFDATELFSFFPARFTRRQHRTLNRLIWRTSSTTAWT